MKDAPARLRLSALRAYGGALDLSGERDLGRRRYEEALALGRESGDEQAMAGLTHRLAMSALMDGDHAQARTLAEESMALSNGRFPKVDIPNHSVLGQVLVAEGEVDAGIALVRKGADLAGAIGWDWWQSGQLDTLASLSIAHGDAEAAERHGREALRLMREQENRHWALYTLTTLARAALARGDLELAGTLWGAVEGETRRVPNPGWEAARERYSGPLAQESRAEFLAARERAGELDLWDAAAIALGEDETQTVP